jgi:hypothetical protein
LIIEPKLLNGRHNLANAIIHAAHFACRSFHGNLLVVKLLVTQLPWMHGVDRKTCEVMSMIKYGVSIPRWVQHEIAQDVRSVIGEKQAKRTIAILFDELNSASRPKFGRIAGFFSHSPVFDDVLIVEFAS